VAELENDPRPASPPTARRPVDLGSVGSRRFVDHMALYGFVALGFPDGMIGTAWPAMRTGFGVPLDGLGLVLLLGTAGAVCSSSVAGLVLARVGLRLTIILGGLIGALGALGVALAPAFWALLAAGTAIGITSGLLDSSLNTAVALAGRNRLLNALHGSYGVGTTIGPLVVTAAILIASWRPAYGVLLLLERGLVGGWWAAGRRGRPAPAPGDLPGPPPRPDDVPAGTAAPAHAGPGRRLATMVALGLVVFMFYTGFEVSAGQWGPSFERGPLHLGAAATGIATFGFWGALTLVRFALAAPRRPLSQRHIVNWGCGIAIFGALLVWWRPTAAVAVIGLVVIGGALAGVFPALVALTPGRVGEEMARHVIGWQVAAASIGGAAISALFGAIFERYGLKYFGPALLITAVLSLAGVLVLERASKPKDRPGERLMAAPAAPA
jgi:fucose permease